MFDRAPRETRAPAAPARRPLRSLALLLLLPLCASLACDGCFDEADLHDENAAIRDLGTDGSLHDRDMGADDLGAGDLGAGDLGASDLGGADGGAQDQGTRDQGTGDAGRDDLDAGAEMGPRPEAGGRLDMASADQGRADQGDPDLGAVDMSAGVDMGGGQDMGPDMSVNPGGCISGAQGDYALRFRWTGTTSGSRAYVRYELNNLPDTSRWKVSSASRSFSYTPTFRDPFLGVGGLELSGSAFIDVELSTQGLPAVQRATLAIFGRSYNTTSPGSFSWMTFSGSGAAPLRSVFNSAPYQWYAADATAALPAGDAGTLLRIFPDGPSNSLIVSEVEVCFETQ